MAGKSIVVIGGTSGIGLEIARTVVARGDSVVLTGRDQKRAEDIAATLGPQARGLSVDVSEPQGIIDSLSSI